MKKKTFKKLVLAKETLRVLEEPVFARVLEWALRARQRLRSRWPAVSGGFYRDRWPSHRSWRREG